MREEDTRKFQTERIRKLFSERARIAVVEFDEDQRLHVRFRVTLAGTTLIASSGEWLPSELADKSDNELWKLIQQLSGGKL